jgi:pimeloyl-ACP methyl ester carboxylesterase
MFSVSGRILLLLAMLVLLQACTGSRVSEADIDAAYKTQAGPYTVMEDYRIGLDFPALNKRLSMRVAFPDEPGSYPLIVFSHGNGCLQDLYKGFADHWASWGYVVVQPVHMDSRETGFTMKGVNMQIMNKVISSRSADVIHILDSLDQLEAQVSGLAGKIDREQFIMAGHSMGAGTAMTLTGVTMVSPRDGSVMSSDENRFDAVILISEPSNNRLMPDKPWLYTKVPTYIATGSKDFSTMGSMDGKKSKGAYQIPADAVVQLQPHYYLYMQDSDHYLGGVICRNNAPGPRDYEALKIINGSSMAFLDAYMADDMTAKMFLDSGEIGRLTEGRATLDLR